VLGVAGVAGVAGVLGVAEPQALITRESTINPLIASHTIFFIIPNLLYFDKLFLEFPAVTLMS
jgi:hypothetical protein